MFLKILHRVMFATSLAFCFCSSVVDAAPQKKVLRVEDTKAFFSWFLSMKQKTMPPKSDFETEVAYRKRLPPPFDTSSIKYFLVPTASGNKPYRYDVATETLTFLAGERERFDIITDMNDPSKGLENALGEETPYFPLILASSYSDTDRYTGSNAFGVKAQITKFTKTDFVLKLQNAHGWPSLVFDKSGGRFAVSTKIDVGAAQKLSRRCQVIIGVRIPSFNRCTHGFADYHKPTIDDPYDTTNYVDEIDANLTCIVVKDTNTGQIILKQEVPETKPVTQPGSINKLSNDETLIDRAEPEPVNAKALEITLPSGIDPSTIVGPVTVSWEVDEKGQAFRVRIVRSCGNRDLDAATEAVIQSCQFLPKMVNGVAASAIMMQTFNFG